MDVADAIEAWGTAHREQLDASGIERLGVVWTTVKRSEVGARDFATLDRDGAARIMGLFAEPDRKAVADLLNTVRTWTRQSDSTAVPTAPPSPGPPSAPGPSSTPGPSSAPADVPIGSASASDAFVGEMSRPEADAPDGDFDFPGPDGDESAPGFGAEPPMSESLLALLSALVLMIVLGVAGYFLFIRSSDSTVDTAADTAPVTSIDATDSSPAPQADYCTTVGDFQQQSPFSGLSISDGSVFYQSIYSTWARVAPTAPQQVAGDIAILQNELSAMNDLAATHNYNANDPAFGAAVRARGLDVINGASTNIANFTIAECGFAIPTGVEGIEAAVPAGAAAAPEGVDPEVVNDG